MKIKISSNYSLVFTAYVLAILTRIYVAFHTAIINVDGIIYISQAKAIYHGQWDKIGLLGINYLPLNSILTVPLFFLTNNWEWAARSVSLITGIGLLIPLYLTLRQFYNRETSGIALLVFALIPTLVSRSNDIIKDPTAWFLLAFAIYFYIANFKSRPFFNLSTSGILFILASWSRNEFIVLYFACGMSMLLINPRSFFKNISLFVAPALFLSIIVVVIFYCLGLDFHSIYRVHRMGDISGGIFESYHKTRLLLADLSSNLFYSNFSGAEFLNKVRSLTWLIPIAIIFTTLTEAMFPIYFLIWLLGVYKSIKLINFDRRYLSFFLMGFCSFVILYWQTLKSWIMEGRWTVILLLSTSPILAHGINCLIEYCANKFNFLRRKTVVYSLIIILTVPGIIKNIKPQRYDKIVYKHIGLLINKSHNSNLPFKIATIDHTAGARWIAYYASSEIPNVLTSDGILVKVPFEALLDSVHLVKFMKNKGTMYFLYEERASRATGVNLMPKGYPLKRIGQWRQKNSGKLALYILS